MRKVVIGGTGMTRFGKFLDSSLRLLAAEAVGTALSDAETEADEIGMVFFGNAAGGLLTAQECVRGQVALRHAGLLGKPIINVENACASSSTAFHLATMAVGSGQCDVALAIGAEKMSNEDKTVPMKALEAAADREEFEELKKRIAPGGAGTGSVFMDLYSSLAREFADRTGATAADYASVSVKQRHAGALNPKAQFQADVTVDEVLESRMIAEPLTLMMCSPIGDGAAALVLMSEDYAARKAIRPVEILASELRSGQGDDPDALAVAEVAAQAAYESAGIGPEDINVAEIHDAAAPAEFIISEQLHFCRPGDAVGLLRDGVTTLGGRMPINPSGGLISKGHPIGATGAAQLVELTDQLRGRSGARQREGARFGLAENAGGWIGNDAAAACVTILGATTH
jgi:acetyl-CoA acetyltransferase